MPSTEDPKTGTTDSKASGGSGEKPTGTTPEAAAGGSAGATQEQVDWKAKAEGLERQKAQLLSEKTAVETERKRVEDERARLAAASPPPNAAGAAESPELQELQRLQQYCLQYPDDVAAKVALRNAIRDIQREQTTQRWNSAQEEIRAKVPETMRERVREAIASGKYADVDAATRAVKGDEADELRQKLAALEKEAEELRKDKEARSKAPVGMGPPGLVGGAPASGEKTMKLSEYEAEIERLQKAGDRKGVLRLIREADTNAVRVTPG